MNCSHRISRMRLAVGLAFLLGWLLNGSTNAQGGGPVWTPITTGAPAGTPAVVSYDASASGLSDSYFDITIHGFWSELVTGPDALTYTKIDVPGLAQAVDMPTPGAPSLPVARAILGLGNDASMVSLSSMTILDQRSFPAFGLVWPDIIPERDDSFGSPPVFVRDEAIYGSTAPWPALNGSIKGPRSVIAGMRGALVEIHPIKWNPASGALTVAASARVHFSHPGIAVSSAPITKERGRLAAQVFVNWPGIQPQFAINTLHYNSNFLFIYPPGYKNELQPLMDQKKARGFAVTELTTAQTGHTCASVRQAIFDWYDSTPPENDKYLLLVGDVDEIPMCTSPPLVEDPLGVPTDDLYGTSGEGEIPFVVNLNKAIHHGRLSVNDESDCAGQVRKILDYEDHASSSDTHYDDVLLAAHKEGAPFKYVGSQEEVRFASYAVPPVFRTRYGNTPFGTNFDVTSDIDGGMGMVVYRGHGLDAGWMDWNLEFGEDYRTDDVDALNNGTKTPVVMAVGCSNSELVSSDCISEHWMSKFPGGGVAAVGASSESWTAPNHEFNRLWFEAIYDKGFTTITHALEYAELEVAKFDAHGIANTWMYLLLGDPDLQIRRRNPDPWQVIAPAYIAACQSGCAPLQVQVLTQSGSPVNDALVAAWKPAGPSAVAGAPADEVFDNRYTGTDGLATLPGTPITPGWIVFTVQDDAGNAIRDSIEVRDMTAVTSIEQPFTFAAQPSVTHASTQLRFGRAFETPVRVVVLDVSGRIVRRLSAAPGMTGLVWDGRDDAGRSVESGLYLARIVVDRRAAMARIVMSR